MQGGACGKNDGEAQKYADEHKLTLYKLQVPMRKLSDIFAENNMSNFGWIMVDVEGAEDTVLQTMTQRDQVRLYLVRRTARSCETAPTLRWIHTSLYYRRRSVLLKVDVFIMLVIFLQIVLYVGQTMM